MVESRTRGQSSLKEGSQTCHECETREHRIVLSPRTGLNGGERGQEQVREAKKQKEEIENPSQDQPKWWRSGAVNLFGPYLGEKRRILSQSGVIPFGSFGWAFARAHSDLRRRLTFHRSWLKAGIYCARRGSREGRSRCKRMAQSMGGKDACQ